MRRLIAAAAVTGALLLAGCSADKTAPAGTAVAPAPAAGAPAGSAPAGAAASSSAAAAASAGDAALAGNTAAICAQASTTGENAAATFAQDLALLLDAESAKDKAATSAAQAKASRDVENYAYALRDMSKLVADPAVKATLASMSTSVEKLKGDIRKIDAAELGRLAGTLGKACGNG